MSMHILSLILIFSNAFFKEINVEIDKLINTSCPNRMEKANQTKFVFFLSLVFPLSLITSTNLGGSLLQKEVSATCWKQFSHIVIAMVTADFDRN